MKQQLQMLGMGLQRLSYSRAGKVGRKILAFAVTLIATIVVMISGSALILSILRDIGFAIEITDPLFLDWTNELQHGPIEFRLAMLVLVFSGQLNVFLTLFMQSDDPFLSVEETAIRTGLRYGWGITRIGNRWIALGPNHMRKDLDDLDDLESFIAGLEATHA